MKKKLKYILSRDLNGEDKDSTFWKIIKAYFKYPTFRLRVWLRITQRTRKHKLLSLYPRLRLNHYKRRLGIDVPASIPIGEGLGIVHGGTVFLNAESIGSYCTFYQGVTLGVGGVHDHNKPRIEDHVTVYTGAVIVGGVTVHSGAIIGANCVVTHDVPPNVLFAGVPGRVVKSYAEQSDVGESKDHQAKVIDKSCSPL